MDPKEMVALAKINGATAEIEIIMRRINRRIAELGARPRVTMEDAGRAHELADLAQWLANRALERLKVGEEIAR